MSIKVKRGLAINLPTLEEGELGFTTDSYEMYVGSDNGNILLNNGEILIRRNNGMLQYAQSSRKNQWFDICSLEEIRGDQGIQGIQGIQGVKGDKGDKGERGIQGEKGNPFTYADFTPDQLRALKGEKGDTGAKGERGLTGDKGDRGVGLNYAWSGTRLGVKRDTDAQYTYVDLRGADGKDGKQGERGERGIQGEKGETPSIAHLEKQVSDKSKELDTKFNTLTAKQQQDAEVVTARDGEVSLHARLERDLEKGKIHFVDVEGSNISTESEEGYLENVEIYGNTWQDANNLSDIRSVGTKVEGQELYEIPVLSCGKNIWNVSVDDFIAPLGNLSVNNGEVIVGGQQRTDCVFYVKPNVNYILSYNYIGDYDLIRWFDKSGAQKGGSINNIVKINSTDGYVRLSFFTNHSTKLDVKYYNIQLEEGTQATPYEPYQEDKLTILSPTPLEKVGNVADRIICKDGVWGVEKNITSFNFNGTEVWNNGGYPTTNHISYRTVMPSRLKYTTQYDTAFICSFDGEKLAWFYIYNIAKDVQGVGYGDNGYFYFRVPNSKTLEMFKQDLSKNPVRVLGVANQPTFIPLPHDQQVKLRTFAERTHITCDTEIQPTIKAQVPKSLGATVNTHTTQIDNLNKELDRVKKLEESTVSTVTSDKAFTTIAETTQGYFEDVKLEGKTLVNLCTRVYNQKHSSIIDNGDSLNYTKHNHYCQCDFKLSQPLKQNATYTVILNTTNFFTNGRLQVNFYRYNEWLVCSNTEYITSNGTHCLLLTTNETIADHIRIGKMNNDVESASEYITLSKDILILEGDHTDKDISYFEGLKSVGQDTDEISVASVGDRPLISDFSHSHNVKTIHCVYTKHNLMEQKNAIEPYLQSFNDVGSYNNCNNLFDYYITDDGSMWINLGTFDRKKALQVLNYKIAEINGRANKKQILYFNPTTQTWEKPILREWDSIEKHSDGKYYYHKRSEETSFTDSRMSVYREDDVYISFSCTGLDGLTVHSSNIICNMINTIKSPLVANEECMYCLSNNYIYIKILKSRLSTPNVEGFKQWLQANNVTIVYQLAQEEVYECTNLDLITYPNETNLIVSSGTIQPRITLKVLSNVSNVVKLLQEKVSVLENKFIEGLKQVLAGDMMSLAHLLYPEDFENNHEIQTLEL